ncbi:hypothetical protein CTDIVETGP_2806 [Clostridium tyrobutyricum DIVETGP]|uniref:Uncharacterized protein n=1 Tax=Clostridium tyrobutyricum DIVETGP TaxID=1408889 RepID=W6N876_CLOTY|nr:hypothetical protein CTK_C13910 [Clostridium tyrobutyricum]CDL92736.1 hypothetical protein CTDIVETGP_2806 [Clostridium tyrobutyricum DIVETGP]
MCGIISPTNPITPLTETMEAVSRVHIIIIVKSAIETTPDDIDKIFSINFKGTFLTDIAAAKQMIKQDTLVIS